MKTLTNAEIAVREAEQFVYAKVLAMIYKAKFEKMSDEDIVKMLITEFEKKTS